MAQYFFGITPSERKNILDQHKSLYDGYVTQYGQNNQQPLYVQDFANDKEGITVNNKGEVKTYTNIGINESHSGLDMIGDGDMDLINGTVDIDGETKWEDEDIEYISLGLNGECTECGEMEEGWDDHRMKRYTDDYSPENYRRLPKVFEPGMEDLEGTVLMGSNEDDFDDDYEEDYEEDDDFDPLMEDELSNEVDEDILPELTQKINESLDMFKRFKKYY